MRSLLRVVPKQPLTLARPFSTGRQLRLKEDSDRSPEAAEEAKQNANKDKEARRQVASSSEEAVGADQQEVKDDKKHMEELQKQTAQETQENHPKAK